MVVNDSPKQKAYWIKNDLKLADFEKDLLTNHQSIS